MNDPYQTLGVSKNASQDEIKNAYRNFAKKHHPDLNPGNKAAEDKFKLATAAYEKIGTKEMREKFDRGETQEQQQEQAERYARQQRQNYHQTQQNGGRYSYSFGEDLGGDDFFENLFRASQSSKSSGPKKGRDQMYQMTVDFKDTILGAEQEITLPHGKKLKIKIPPGIETGTQLRFKNQGEQGATPELSGDAYVQITVRPLEGFKKAGNNIETQLPISFIEAILGAEIKVSTLDGVVLLKILPHVSTGSKLRIKGKGVALKNKPGDQIVELKVVTPDKISPELERSIKEIKEKFNYNPREAI